ncbi:Uncharacterised protein [Mycobacteroides abscessus subsp. abscessus]|nr:Uncharacterised protein [Mycobacteroides abscessus subsp. abscessus]
MRRWKKVLPPEEAERRADDDDAFNDEYDASEETVVAPEADEPAPEFRDPYVDAPKAKPKRQSTLASRTGSKARPQRE